MLRDYVKPEIDFQEMELATFVATSSVGGPSPAGDGDYPGVGGGAAREYDLDSWEWDEWLADDDSF